VRRLHLLLGLVVLVAGAPSSRAITPWSPWDSYRAELRLQCPGKQLDRLDPTDVRDALLAYQASLPQQEQNSIRDAKTSACSSGPYPHTAMCEASSALGVILKQGRLPQAVARVCRSYEGCNDQSDCKAAVQ